MPEETVEPWGETKIIGKRIPRVDGYERVSGAAVYPSDVMLPNMLYAAILRSPHPHAMVKKVDVAEARKMPGVHAVLTDADPEARAVGWYQVMGSRMPLTIPLPDPKGRAVMSRLFDPHCRYVGDEVAAVAAETPQQAWDAVRAIKVEYEVLPFVLDIEKALEPGAPALHPGGNQSPSKPVTYKRGSVEQGFAAADVVVDESYVNAVAIHSTMEVHGSVTQWDGDHLTIWDTTQGVFRAQVEIAAGLNLPASNVRVIGKYCGGGFGSKLEPGKYSVIAALLAKKTARPVKLFLTREEEFLSTGNRAGLHMRVKMGVKKDGTLTAIEMKSLAEVGAYPSRASVADQFTEPYTCPNVSTEETYIMINAGRCRWMRAPSTSGNWALEQVIDSVADKIGMDPVEFRIKNHSTFNQAENKPYFSNGGRECLIEGARVFGWKEARSRPKGNGHLLRGVGVASAVWAGDETGFGTVILKVYADGTAILNTGATDLGTGWKTVAAMIVAEELGIPPNRVQIECADTATTQYSSNAGGEKTVQFDGPAVRLAALDIKGQLLEMAAEQLKVPVSNLVYQDGVILAQGGGQKLAIKDLTGWQNLALAKSQMTLAAMARSRLLPHGASNRKFGSHFRRGGSEHAHGRSARIAHADRAGQRQGD